MLVGHLRHATGRSSRRLLDALPAVVVLAGEMASPLVALLADEIVKDEPGQEAVLDRLLDLVLIAVLRTWFARPGGGRAGWYRAHGDPVVGRRCALLHNDPAHPWTVAVARRRRSACRGRRSRGGSPSWSASRRWRSSPGGGWRSPPTCCSSRARRSARSPDQVGYGSAFALSAAFKRVRGSEPARAPGVGRADDPGGPGRRGGRLSGPLASGAMEAAPRESQPGVPIGRDAPIFEVMATMRAMRRLKPDPVPRELLLELVEAATWAPSGGNVQAYQFVVVTDRAQMARMGELWRAVCDDYLATFATVVPEGMDEAAYERLRGAFASSATTSPRRRRSSCLLRPRPVARRLRERWREFGTAPKGRGRAARPRRRGARASARWPRRHASTRGCRTSCSRRGRWGSARRSRPGI